MRSIDPTTNYSWQVIPCYYTESSRAPACKLARDKYNDAMQLIASIAAINNIDEIGDKDCRDVLLTVQALAHNHIKGE